MINPVTGEVEFGELILSPHQNMNPAPIVGSIKQDSPIIGYQTIHPARPIENAYGLFNVQLTLDSNHRLILISMCHQNDFYQSDTYEDHERKIFHDSIVAKDLSGQREFQWGEVANWFCGESKIEFLNIIYTPGSPVVRKPKSNLSSLEERKTFPGS